MQPAPQNAETFVGMLFDDGGYFVFEQSFTPHTCGAILQSGRDRFVDGIGMFDHAFSHL